MWEQLGYDVEETLKIVENAEGQIRFRKRLFSRIVPTVRDIGLWSDKVQKAYAELGGMQYANTTRRRCRQRRRVAEEFASQERMVVPT